MHIIIIHNHGNNNYCTYDIYTQLRIHYSNTLYQLILQAKVRINRYSQADRCGKQ